MPELVQFLESNTIRLKKEQQLQNSLLSISEISKQVKINNSNESRNHYQLLHYLYAEGLLLDKRRSPEIYECIEKIKILLSIKTDITIFLANQLDTLAGLFISNNQIVIVLHSKLLDLLNLEELCFVIGHELGHFKFEHYLLSNLDLEGLPSRFTLQIYEHSRLSELSADRAGLISCGSFATCYSALNKVASGSSSPLIKFSFQETDFQADKLRELLKNKEYLLEAKRSHPYSILRIGALHALEYEFLNQCSKDDNIKGHQNAEAKVLEILEIMSPKKSDNTSWLLSLAAIWVAYSDGKISLSERKEVAKLCSDSEFTELYNLCRTKDNPCIIIEDIFHETYTSVNLSLAQKALFMEKLVAVAFADGKLSPKEKSTLKYISELIDLDERFLMALLKL